MVSEIKRERSKKGMAGLEKGEENISSLNRLRSDFMFDRQTEIGSVRSQNRRLVSLHTHPSFE
jgi:hypothetical protein